MSAPIQNITNLTPTTPEKIILEVAVTKGIRYQQALNNNESDRNCVIYTAAKTSFKSLAQACLRNGVTLGEFKQGLSLLDITEEVQDVLFKNLDAKMLRYQKKLSKSKDTSVASVDQFVEAAKQLKDAFEAVHSDPRSDATYREFRIAKKGLANDPAKHVGFFKFLKKNKAVVKQHAELLRAMCAAAGITHFKISNKISHASKPV